MLNKMPIRLRFTILTVALLTVCCIGLTVILNFSANRMATKIDSTPALPAQNIGENDLFDGNPQPPIDNISSIESFEASQKARIHFRTESIIYMLVIISSGGFLTYYISGRVLNPLKKLNDQVKNIDAHNLSEPLTVPHTKDEIAELTVTFNKMASKLNDSFKVQQRFSASAAHELRTPLAVLQTKVDVFKKVEKHTFEEYDAFISVVEKQTKRLRGLVSNLLDMTNMINIDDQSSIEAEIIFEEIISELSYIAKEFNVSISLDCDNSVLFGNIDLLHRAFYNLIENAIKYNTADGKVQIVVKKSGKKHVSIKIKDSGIGISKKDKEHIFEPFYRADQSRSRQLGGTGLGLSTVEDIIKKHNGTITFVSNENNGTCFNVILNRGLLPKKKEIFESY